MAPGQAPPLHCLAFPCPPLLPTRSGLASSQHYSGLVLGGPGNLLARADPLCNVVGEKVEAARAYFAR